MAFKHTFSKLLIMPFALLALNSCSDNNDKLAQSASSQIAGIESVAEHAKKHLDPKYVCPMHPQIIKDAPGSCPICGMDLIAKTAADNDDKYPVVEIKSAVVQNLGVKTQAARKDTLWKYIRTLGRTDYDETSLKHIHPRTSGWLEVLYFKVEGEPVSKGEKLAELYSPEILSAQLDYLVAIEQTGRKNTEKARNRLRLLGVTETTINAIEKRGASQNRIPLHAPGSGIMIALSGREGMYVKPEMEIFTIADMSRIWVWVDIFEYQIDWLQTGLSAQMSVPAYPQKTWEGKLDYIYPELDKNSRTLKARLVLDNPDGKLKANMFAEVIIYGGPKHNALVVPSSAVIESGKRTVVIKELGNGRFQPVDVVIGMQRNGRSEILSGVEEGDRVVVSGQFLIDSESSLQASFQRMSGDN